jgi:hypothetical protein
MKLLKFILLLTCLLFSFEKNKIIIQSHTNIHRAQVSFLCKELTGIQTIGDYLLTDNNMHYIICLCGVEDTEFDNLGCNSYKIENGFAKLFYATKEKLAEINLKKENKKEILTRRNLSYYCLKESFNPNIPDLSVDLKNNELVFFANVYPDYLLEKQDIKTEAEEDIKTVAEQDQDDDLQCKARAEFEDGIEQNNKTGNLKNIEKKGGFSIMSFFSGSKSKKKPESKTGETVTTQKESVKEKGNNKKNKKGEREKKDDEKKEREKESKKHQEKKNKNKREEDEEKKERKQQEKKKKRLSSGKVSIINL